MSSGPIVTFNGKNGKAWLKGFKNQMLDRNEEDDKKIAKYFGNAMEADTNAEEGCSVFARNGSINRWFYEITRRVWSSFTVTGQPIKKATFFVGQSVIVTSFGPHRKAPKDLNMIVGDAVCAKSWERRHVPYSEPIVIATVRDDAPQRYYSDLEDRANVVASHHLIYEELADYVSPDEDHVGGDKAVPQIGDEIFNNNPRGFYHKYDHRQGEVSQDT